MDYATQDKLRAALKSLNWARGQGDVVMVSLSAWAFTAKLQYGFKTRKFRIRGGRVFACGSSRKII